MALRAAAQPTTLQVCGVVMVAVVVVVVVAVVVVLLVVVWLVAWPGLGWLGWVGCEGAVGEREREMRAERLWGGGAGASCAWPGWGCVLCRWCADRGVC